MAGTRPKQSETSLCWGCAKACGGCSWSERAEPVEGWTAKRYEMKVGDRSGRTEAAYCVKKCPEFERDRFRRGKLELNYDPDEEGVAELARKVLILAGQDYTEAAEDLDELRQVPASPKTLDAIMERTTAKRSIEKFLEGGNLFTELLGLDGDSMIAKIRR